MFEIGDKVIVNYKEFINAPGIVFDNDEMDLYNTGRISIKGLPGTPIGSYCLIPVDHIELFKRA